MVDAAAAIDWSKISKTGSSLADLTTRSASDLSSGTLPAARFQPWAAVTFAAGDFTASGAMTWTVAAGDVVSNRYTIVGKTLIWACALGATTVAGTPSTELRIAIPGGNTAVGYCLNPLAVVTDNGVQSVGFVDASGGNTYVSIKLNLGGTNWSASTDNTAVFFQIMIEIS